MSLLYGTTTFNQINDDVPCIRRSYLSEITDVYLNRSNEPAPLPEGAMQPARMLAGFLTEGA